MKFLISLLLLGWPLIFNGLVTHITDGDTFKANTENGEVIVRISSIDAPESSQPYGDSATIALTWLCLNDSVTIRNYGKDRYGRLIGEVVNSSGQNIGRYMVRHGYAWHYEAFSRDFFLETLEDSAQVGSLGLWSQAMPMQPWIYRHGGWQKTSQQIRAQSRFVDSILNANPDLGIPIYK